MLNIFFNLFLGYIFLQVDEMIKRGGADGNYCGQIEITQLLFIKVFLPLPKQNFGVIMVKHRKKTSRVNELPDLSFLNTNNGFIVCSYT